LGDQALTLGKSKEPKSPGFSDLPYRFMDQLKALPFVEAIYLYGSRARGDHSPRSDIDLAILCPYASHKDWLKVLEIIEESDTLLGIDCIRLDELKDGDRLKEKILRQGRSLYQKGGASIGT
jgi:predicted nucleotidyltransferase